MSETGKIRVEVVEFLKFGFGIVKELLNKISKTANPETRQGVKKTGDLSYSAVYCLDEIIGLLKGMDVYSVVELDEVGRKKISDVMERIQKRLDLFPKSNKGNFYASRRELGRIYGRVNELWEGAEKLVLEEVYGEIGSIISCIHSFSDEERFAFQVKEDEKELYKAVRKNKRNF
jgi:hypothetical protein